MSTSGILSEREQKLSTAGYNENTERHIQAVEIINSYINFLDISDDVLRKGMHHIKQDYEESRGPALIVGSGDSFDHVRGLLSKWQGAVVCSPSQASTCVYQGRDPDYIVVMDPWHKWETMETVDTWKGRDSVLVISPCIDNKFVRLWPNKKLYYRPMELSTLFYTRVLRTAYSFIESILLVYAHSISAQVSIAHALGYSPLVLIGCDFTYHRFRSWLYKDGQWAMGPKLPPWKKRKSSVRWQTRNGSYTDNIQLMYKQALFQVLRLDMPKVINCSGHRGIIDELPMTSFEDAVERSNEGGFEDLIFGPQKQKDVLEIYMARHNKYGIPISVDGGALSWVETDEPEEKIPPYCKQINEKGAKIDIDSVMVRVRWLREYIKENP